MKLLIDADSLLYGKDQDELEIAIKYLDTKIQTIIRETQIYEFALFLTSYKNYRKDVNSDYKMNRKDKVRPTHILELRKHMEDTYEVIVLEGYEADDLVASVYREDMYNYTIASIDKDILRNLPGKHFNLHYKKMCFNSYVNTEEANMNFCEQLLTGDKTDNIPSITLNQDITDKYELSKVRGVGPATAKRIINNGVNKYGYTPLEVVMDAFRMSGESFDDQYKQISIGMFNKRPKMKFNTVDIPCDNTETGVYSGDFTIGFGKYKTKRVSWVHKNDNRYFNWLYENVDHFNKKCTDEGFKEEA